MALAVVFASREVAVQALADHGVQFGHYALYVRDGADVMVASVRDSNAILHRALRFGPLGAQLEQQVLPGCRTLADFLVNIADQAYRAKHLGGAICPLLIPVPEFFVPQMVPAPADLPSEPGYALFRSLPTRGTVVYLEGGVRPAGQSPIDNSNPTYAQVHKPERGHLGRPATHTVEVEALTSLREPRARVPSEWSAASESSEHPYVEMDDILPSNSTTGTTPSALRVDMTVMVVPANTPGVLSLDSSLVTAEAGVTQSVDTLPPPMYPPRSLFPATSSVPKPREVLFHTPAPWADHLLQKPALKACRSGLLVSSVLFRGQKLPVLTRDEANERLDASGVVGSFLLRVSASQAQALALSLISLDGRLCHYQIAIRGQDFVFADNEIYPSLEEMLASLSTAHAATFPPLINWIS